MANKTITLYPTKITTVNERSTKTNVQKLSHKANLCSPDTSLAYWGTKKPLWLGNYLRNYPDSLTSISGSFYKPAKFTASGFKIANENDKGTVNSIKIEYKWEQISYSSQTAYGTFDKPIITVRNKNKTLAKIEGAKPEKNRYNNCKKGSCVNSDTANLATLHSHKVTFSGKNKPTVGDLKKNFEIIFAPAKNTSHNHLRIVMQFFRITINYTPYVEKTKEPETKEPNFTIKSSINKKQAFTDEEYEYALTLSSDKAVNERVSCLIDIPNNTNVLSYKITGTGEYLNGQWYIDSFVNNTAKLVLKCKTIKTNAHASFYGTYFYKKQSKKTESWIKIVDNYVSFDFFTDLPRPMIYLEGDTENGGKNSFTITMNRNEKISNNEKILINMQGLIVDESEDAELIDNDNGIYKYGKWNKNSNEYKIRKIKNNPNYDWEIYDINTNKITLKTTYFAVNKNVGDFELKAVYTNSYKTIEKKINFVVTKRYLQKEFFKLRLEDGSDVKYNSLMFTAGDDLKIPLTYEIEDVYDAFKDDTIIIGDEKRIPTNEAKFASFDIYIESKKDETYKNVIAYLTAYNEEESCDEIIVGSDDSVELYEGFEKTYCVIKELKTNTHNKVSLIVESDEEQDVSVQLKPLGYNKYDTNEWKPMYINFKDIPNIQIKIDGQSELIYNNPNKATVDLTYRIQNKSDIDGKDLKFKIIEHPSFKELNVNSSIDSNSMFNDVTFNPNKRIIHFGTLEAHSQEYVLEIEYQATKKGIYDFIIQTYDDSNNLEDDQYINIYKHKLLVNVETDIDVKTSVSNSRPHLNEIIEYKIQTTNYSKPQNEIIFSIADIGQYEETHELCDYKIIEYDGDGIFTESEENNNFIGQWTLNNVGIGDKNELTLSLKPIDTGAHVIRTTLSDSLGNTKYYENLVKIYEENKKIDLNVYHAINPTEEENCCNPDKLVEICDDDFISINDDIYYVFEITNRQQNSIDNVHVYARIPKSFTLTECTTQGYKPIVDKETGLINFIINNLPSCEPIKFCIKVTPQEKGNFISNFMLSTSNAHVLNKQLKLTVDSYFSERKTEHEIIIYNFEKTNRYFRYELDGDNNLYKFYNKGDISKRTVDIENHNASQLEIYKGSTLKELVKNIKDNSKYVEPELLRIGSNHLASKGYELYPNGFINRFGLLNSEVFHYTGQLPKISNLVDYAMRWDVDDWDTKLWSGDIYQNGVFDLTIKYSDIPTNFNILELDNPINNLQAIVDRVKPFGTKAICYFAVDVMFTLRLEMELLSSCIELDSYFELELDKIGLISWYNRHDNSIAIYYDLVKYYLNMNDIQLKVLNDNLENSNYDIETDVDYRMDVFTDKIPKQYIKECYDIVENLQNTNNYIRNITISKQDFSKKNIQNDSVNEEKNIGRVHEDDIYNIYFESDINNKDIVGIYLTTENEPIYCQYRKDELLLDKFELIDSDKNIINTINIENVNDFKIQIQCCSLDNKNKIIHFWVGVNQQDYQYLGYYIIKSSFAPALYVFNKPNIKKRSAYSFSYTYGKPNDKPITFSIDDNKKYTIPKYNEYYTVKNVNGWKNVNRLNKEYMYIKTEYDECDKDKSIKTPKLMLRYDKFNLDKTDEIQDIYFDIKSNKNLENINIDVFKDGTSYLPKNKTSKKIYYPKSISSVDEEYVSTISIQQPNITICGHCMKTSLGYYDKCPYCDSDKVVHQKEKEPVTICYNCDYIADGWNNYCTHCLSKDIVKTEVDYNKTYCYNCQNLHDDYYNACPYCFSANIIHLQNDIDMYKIYNENIQNIKPIIIKSNINKVNLCNITIPLNKNSHQINELKKLELVMDLTNNNDGKYYYCTDCETIEIGDYNKCQYCSSDNIIKYNINNLSIDIVSNINGEIKLVKTENNIKNNKQISIDILDFIKNNNRDNFTIQIYAENPSYDVDKYPEEINTMDLIVNNFSFNSVFNNNNAWIVGEFNGEDRDGLKYITNNNSQTNYIAFNQFDIDVKNVKNLYLHINGVNKSLSYIKMNIKILTGNKTYNFNSYVKSNLFNIEENISKDKLIDLDDISVQISFYDVKPDNEIIITDCYLLAESYNQKTTIPKINTEKVYINNYEDKKYKISSDNLWGLNDDIPKYMSGEMLQTGLLACFDFGNIKIGEIFKIYEINMIIIYKNKFGNFITNSLPITDDTLAIQLINGNIVKNNAENWGNFKVSNVSLNNLESEIINTDNEKLLDSIPVLNTISQSFKPEFENIYKITLQYAGKIGYPSEYITVSIYDDYNNAPDVMLAKQKVVLPSIPEDIDIDFYINRLDKENKYWIIIEDKNANEYNYHKFRHNTNNSVGNLILTQNNISTKYDHMSLSFAVQNGYEIREYIDLPTSCEIETDINSDFKLYNSFYRFNAQVNSNVYLSNLFIKSGYTFTEDVVDNLENEEDDEDIIVYNAEYDEENNTENSISSDDCDDISMPIQELEPEPIEGPDVL